MRAPGEELVGKLWVTLADNAVGGLLRPWQIRREGRAKLEVQAEEVVAMAIAEKKAKEIAGDGGSLESVYVGVEAERLVGRIEPTISAEHVVEIAREISLKDFLRRERNMAEAILVAEEELLSFKGEVTDKEIEEDWIQRWRSLAGEVSAKDLQYLWGQILAGETKTPGQYSLRTLDFLKNLSQDEAKDIESIAPFVVGGRIIKGVEGFPEDFGVSDGTLLYLQSVGVLSSVDSISTNVQWGSYDPDRFEHSFVVGDRALIIEGKSSDATIRLPVIIITEVGKQVLSLVKSEPNEKYIFAVGRRIKELGFNVRVAKVISIVDDWVEHDDGIEL